jgi:hypothetical protein
MRALRNDWRFITEAIMFERDLKLWTKYDLIRLLNLSGYEFKSNEILTAKYERTTRGGAAVFRITFPADEDAPNDGDVYVMFRDGELVADF